MQIENPGRVGMSAERLERVTPALSRYVGRGQVAGMVSLIARKGQVVSFLAQGAMDLASGRPMPLDAIVRVYSMTKPVTAAAFLTLWEQGLIHLDDPVAEYIPAFADTPVFVGVGPGEALRLEAQASPMTVRQLLTHTSGLSYGRSNIPALAKAFDGFNWREVGSLAETVSAFTELPMLFQPGTQWSYSFAIDVVGRLIEIVSGRALDVYMREALFEPLGMVDTGFSVPAAKVDRVATLYTSEGDGALIDISEQMPTQGWSMLSGGGGLFSTATDYWRFAQMLCNGGILDGERILSRKTVALMGSNQLPDSLIPFVPQGWPYRLGHGMGLGVRVMIDPVIADAPGSVGLFTWGGAAMTDFWVDPCEQMVGVLMLQYLGSIDHLLQDHRCLAYQALED